MFIALMLAGYVATKFNDKKTSEDTRDGSLVVPPGMTGTSAPVVTEETDWTLGAEAWVAFPPVGPTL